jgi:hypothetical protein
MGSSQNRQKSVKTSHNRLGNSQKEGIHNLSQRPGKGCSDYRDFGCFDPSPEALHSGLRYCLFTAADEKIALSVVRVNTKPQYLVFDVHFLHLASKHKDLRVESSQRSCAERG